MDDAAATLTIGTRKGTFPGMEKSRTFRLLVVKPRTEKNETVTINYNGKRKEITLLDKKEIMQRIIYLAILLSFTISCQSGLKPLTSPNGKIRVEASNTVGQPTLTITYSDAGSSYTLFDNLLTGLKTDRRNLTDSMKLVSVTSPVEMLRSIQ